MTRVAILPSSYPPSLGGVEELTRHLALALGDAGDQVEVWTGHPNDATPETVEVLDGIVVRRLPMPLPATNWSAIRRSAVTGTRTLFSLRSAVAAFRPDILHVQCFGPNGAYAHALSRLTGLPLVVTLQGETLMDDTDIFDVSRVLRSSLRSGLRRAAAVTGCSAFTLADAEDRFGLEPGRGQVISNGVDLGEGAGTDATSSNGHAANGSASNGRNGSTASVGSVFATEAGRPDRPYVLALGRVVEKKGFDLLLAAYAAIDDAHRSSDLVIGGQGEALEDLRRTAAALGIADRVHFVGRLSREKVAEAMAGATMFVMPSRLEPFGIVILEAWRAGPRWWPPIGEDLREFVRDGHDGVLVDPFDTTAFAHTLEDLLLDPERARRIGEAGRVRVREFGWPSIAEQYRQVYSSAVEARSGRAASGGGSASARGGVGPMTPLPAGSGHRPRSEVVAPCRHRPGLGVRCDGIGRTLRRPVRAADLHPSRGRLLPGRRAGRGAGPGRRNRPDARDRPDRPSDPRPSRRQSPCYSYESLAARFAAKEATVKVLRPVGARPDWRDIEVHRSSDGWTEIRLFGKAAVLAAEAGIDELAVSLTHEGSTAAAVVVGVCRPGDRSAVQDTTIDRGEV